MPLDAELVRKVAWIWVVLAGAFLVFDLFRKVSVGLTDGEAGRSATISSITCLGWFLALYQRAAEIYTGRPITRSRSVVGAAVSPNYNYSYPPIHAGPYDPVRAAALRAGVGGVADRGW